MRLRNSCRTRFLLNVWKRKVVRGIAGNSRKFSGRKGTRTAKQQDDQRREGEPCAHFKLRGRVPIIKRTSAWLNIRCQLPLQSDSAASRIVIQPPAAELQRVGILTGFPVRPRWSGSSQLDATERVAAKLPASPDRYRSEFPPLPAQSMARRQYFRSRLLSRAGDCYEPDLIIVTFITWICPLSGYT